MKKLLFALLIALIAIPASAQSMKMVVDSKGRLVGKYIKTSGKHYVVGAHDFFKVPKSRYRVVTYSAAKGQGEVTRKEDITGNIADLSQGFFDNIGT